MSSAAIITISDLDDPVPADSWWAFCDAYDIVHSPRTVGGNVFYRGDVQVAVKQTMSARTDGIPEEIRAITVSTFHMGDVASVAELAATIWQVLGGRLEADPEVKQKLVGEWVPYQIASR